MSNPSIGDLKYIARRAYERHAREVDGMDCGATLAAHINPRAAEAARDFNAAMDELAKIDPSCPPRRLSE